jgi:hypothetical protein
MMDSQDILRELKKVLIRYRAGLIDADRCRQELSVLLAMMRAYEDVLLEEKLNRIQAVLEMRS